MHAFAASDFEGDLDEPWPGAPTPLFAGPQGASYGDARAPAFRSARQWNVKGGMGLILGAFVVLYGGVVLLHRYEQAAPSAPVARADSASKSVEGAIGSNGGAQPPQKLDDSVPPDMSIANLPPPVTSSAPPVAAQAQPAPAPTQTQAPPPTPALTATQPPVPAPTQTPTPTFTLAPAPSPSVTTGTVSPPAMADAGAQQTTPNAGDDARGKSHSRTRGHGKNGDWRSRYGDKTLAQAQAQAAPQPQAQPQPQPQPRETRASAATRTLDSVQARLAKNDLGGARASLSGVLATDPRNGYALSLRDQLASREQARDASLSAARACVVQSRWHCVWHNAGTALSIDASSTEAKALVDRAIIESGAATAPAGPGPDNVEVPMVQ
jgi:hypothetical protein